MHMHPPRPLYEVRVRPARQQRGRCLAGVRRCDDLTSGHQSYVIRVADLPLHAHRQQ